MNNFLKTKSWLKLVLGDLNTALTARHNEDFDDAVYHLQQSVEKGCKAILHFLGVEPRKTHFPADQLIRAELLENSEEIKHLQLNSTHIQILREIVNETLPLEDQGTIPRYGQELEDRIILPSDIYDQEKTNELFQHGTKALKAICAFLEDFRCPELKEELGDVRNRIEKL